MPSFTLVISDEPFTRDDIGPAPFIETIDHGANSNCSTPATEAFKRCLDAVADSSFVRDDEPESEDNAMDDNLPAELRQLADTLEHGIGLLESIVNGSREDGFPVEGYARTIPAADIEHGNTRIQEARHYLRDMAEDVQIMVENALEAVRDLASWPSAPEGDDE